jgi:hypothetical protein
LKRLKSVFDSGLNGLSNTGITGHASPIGWLQHRRKVSRPSVTILHSCAPGEPQSARIVM